jgi:hypothetical protein
MKAHTIPLVVSLVLFVAPVRGTPQAAPAAPAPGAEELKARERHAILNVRTVAMAGKTYAAANGSLFGELVCLKDPASCGTPWPSDSPFPLDPSYEWEGVKLGYLRRFHPGPRAGDEEARRAGAAAGSLKAFAYTAAPERPGETGLRSFCGDTSGRLCVAKDGREPPVKDGRCDPCQKLE